MFYFNDISKLELRSESKSKSKIKNLISQILKLQPAIVRLHSSCYANDKAELYVRGFHSWS